MELRGTLELPIVAVCADCAEVTYKRHTGISEGVAISLGLDFIHRALHAINFVSQSGTFAFLVPFITAPAAPNADTHLSGRSPPILNSAALWSEAND